MRSKALHPARHSDIQSTLAKSEGLDTVRSILNTLTIDDIPPLLHQMTDEHFHISGKMVRARLALAVGEAYGVQRGHMAPWGAAVELVHNATLVHDDIQDEDTTRRGQPTAWVRHGPAQAINLGDYFLMMVNHVIDQVVSEEAVKWYLSRALTRRASATVAGQVRDLQLGPDSDWTWEAYRKAVEGKTGHLIALPVEGSLLMARFAPEQARSVADLFLTVGVLYQYQDDVLDVFGDKQRGQVACDLYEGKVSALVVADSLLHPNEEPALRELLRTPRHQTCEHEVARVIKRFHEGGALDMVLDQMRELRDAFWANDWGELENVAQDLVDATVKPIQAVWS